MLIQNDWRIDTRVIREASALASRDMDVHVICRRVTTVESVEVAHGVSFHVVPVSDAPTPREILRLFQLHKRVLAMSGGRSGRSPFTRMRAYIRGLVPSMLLLAVGLAVPLLILRALARHDRFSHPSLVKLSASLLHRVGMTLQPFRYLNDCSLKCLERLVALEPDVIHAHDLVTLSAAALGAEMTSALLIYDAHELETHTNYDLAPATKRWLERYEFPLSRRADRVVTVCDSIADWLASNYGIRRPVVVMNSPASGPLQAEPDSDMGLRAHLRLEKSVRLAVYVGSVTIDRGLELCVDALELLPDVHLATVGPRYADTELAMRSRAAALGVTDRLHFVDPRPADEIVSFIASADCSVMPIQNVCLSYYFCFPNKLLESVFAGLPVVVGDLFELRNFVSETGVGVVVDETSPVSIAEGIARVTQTDAFRPSAIVRQEVAAVYGWPEQRSRLYGMYSELLGSLREVDVVCAE
jgi:glycosyltransferase involved in cell wall biosynthesis